MISLKLYSCAIQRFAELGSMYDCNKLVKMVFDKPKIYILIMSMLNVMLKYIIYY